MRDLILFSETAPLLGLPAFDEQMIAAEFAVLRPQPRLRRPARDLESRARLGRGLQRGRPRAAERADVENGAPPLAQRPGR